jgi:hypothetical protein
MTVVQALGRAGLQGVQYLMANPQSAKVALTVAGPDVARYFLRNQIDSLFPGLGQFLPMIEGIGNAALAVGPIMLMAPEAAPLGATYILLVAVREGGLLLVRFTSIALYNYLKYWITHPKPKHSPGDIELISITPEAIGEGWVVVQQDANSLSSNDFVFVEGAAANNLLQDLEVASGAPRAVFAAEESPKVTIHSHSTDNNIASVHSSEAAAPRLLHHVLDDYPTSTGAASAAPAHSNSPLERPHSANGPSRSVPLSEAHASSSPVAAAHHEGDSPNHTRGSPSHAPTYAAVAAAARPHHAVAAHHTVAAHDGKSL